MKLLKKVAYIVVVCSTVTSCLSCIYANERVVSQKKGQIIKEFTDVKGFNVKAGLTTPDVYDYRPVVDNMRVVTIDSKLCIMVHVQAYNSITSVYIDGKSATRRNGGSLSGDYYIEADGTKTYKAVVRDSAGKEGSYENYMTISDSIKPTVTLSKIYKNGYCYLQIKAEDNNGISSVKVDNSSISFSTSGGTETYRVTQSRTYTVEVKDAAGNVTTEKIDINVEEDKPSLTLEKVYKDGKWYIRIKSYPASGQKISKVTVNNSSISFSSGGEDKDYAVPSTGNYSVIVTDNSNQQNSQSIYVDCSLTNDSLKPTLSAVAKDVGSSGMMDIDITAYPSTAIANNKLSQVSVNGVAVAVPATGGRISYSVTASGSYNVVATDVNGNTITQVVYVNLPNASTQTTNNVAVGSSKAVFKIKQSSYTLNGVTQTMDGAPALKNGRTMLPVRYVAYALNIEPNKIIWDKATKTVTIYDGSNIIKAPLNSKKITVNGVDQTMEVAATMINGRVYIPISQIAKAFSGVSINWNSSTKEATIARN